MRERNPEEKTNRDEETLTAFHISGAEEHSIPLSLSHTGYDIMMGGALTGSDEDQGQRPAFNYNRIKTSMSIHIDHEDIQKTHSPRRCYSPFTHHHNQTIEMLSHVNTHQTALNIVIIMTIIVTIDNQSLSFFC